MTQWRDPEYQRPYLERAELIDAARRGDRSRLDEMLAFLRRDDRDDVFVAALIPFPLAWVGAYYRVKQFGSLDNKHPRIQGAALEGAGARAWAAQQNAWEALPVFASAVFVAHLAGADPQSSANAALLFLAARFLHPVAYIANVDVARSLIFLVGIGSCVWLFVLAARA